MILFSRLVIIFWRTSSAAKITLHIQTSVTAGSLTKKKWFTRQVSVRNTEVWAKETIYSYFVLHCTHSMHLSLSQWLFLCALLWFDLRFSPLFSLFDLSRTEKKCIRAANKSRGFSLTFEACSWQQCSMKVWRFPSVCQKTHSTALIHTGFSRGHCHWVYNTPTPFCNLHYRSLLNREMDVLPFDCHLFALYYKVTWHLTAHGCSLFYSSICLLFYSSPVPCCLFLRSVHTDRHPTRLGDWYLTILQRH